MMKYLTTACVAALFFWATIAGAQPSPQVYVAGRLISTQPASAFTAGQLVGPWADYAKAAGATVSWDADATTLKITSVRGKVIVARPGLEITVDGETRKLSAPAQVSEGKLVAPLKSLFESLDCVLDWDTKTNVARISGKIIKLETRADERGVAVAIVSSLPARGQLTNDVASRKVFVDLPHAYLSSARPLNYVNLGGVLRVRCGQFSDKPPTVRLVSDLSEGAPAAYWEPRDDRCGGRLLVGKPGPTAPLVERPQPRLLKVVAASAGPDEATLTAYLTDPVEVQYDVLRSPYRVLLDLAGANMAAMPATVPTQGPFLDQIRLLENGRLALYMSELVPFTVRNLSNPERVQVTFRRERLAGKRIMIDPGHGGKDSGALGKTLLEKDINLDVARRTAARLALMDAQPYLTRDTDVFIDLYERPRMTNDLPADLFVSIHCNAGNKPNTGWGTGTYYCHPQSKELAVVLQDVLAPILGRRDTGVHQARFCVVRETQIPAVLVELLFIDNVAEEALLGQPETRQKAAVGICEGIRRYLEGTASIAPAILQENETG